MNKSMFAFLSAAALTVLGSQAQARDRCQDEDHVSRVDRYSGADVIHYDHHHYGSDRYGREIAIHHDHHYVVPNDNYERRYQSRQHRGNFLSFIFGR